MTNETVSSYPVLMSKPATRGPYTLEDWLAEPEDAYLELVDGELIQKAAPGFDHGGAQGAVMATLRGAFVRKPGGAHGPGGWWLGSEVDIRLGQNVFRPDVAGWRRDCHAERPNDWPVTARPDWICEVVSDSNRKHDTIVKVRHYHHAGIPHYWLLDPLERTLAVYRHTPEGYLLVLAAQEGERVRAEPFEAIELEVSVLLGEDPED